ncbi:MAG: S-layer homology domain-containing protein [Clostridia bacterium]|nr:S-layer homology domain-containing protein [Clostridia bacterium]
MTRAEFCAVIAGLFEEYDEKNMDIYIANDKNFSDVRTDFWYTPYIGFVVSEGIMNGYDAGRFNPNTNTTRAEVCKVLASIFKFENKNVENKFKDELKGQWYEEAVTTLVEAGMINGYDDGTFKGNNNITRAELVILINRITGKSISDEEVEKLDVPFKDLKKTNWYYKDILIASR